MKNFSYLLLGIVLLASNAVAQEAGVVQEIVVPGRAINTPDLGATSSAGSRLGLTVMETPASIELIDSSVMRARGYKSVADAVKSLPGVVSGESPAAPSTFSMRGFSRSAITVLRDGIWLGPANMVMRPQNTFNLDRVEVLRGPGSALHGQGVVGGTVNSVVKRATATEQPIEMLASYGRFGTYQFGLGGNTQLGDSTWLRLDVNQYGSDGYVDRMDPESTNVTASVLWQATEDFDVEFQVDYLDDSLADYWGTPLVPQNAAVSPLDDVVKTSSGETVDKRARFRNFNVRDSRAVSDQLLFRMDLSWQLSDNIELKNTTYSFNADRDWGNAEGYVYCTTLVDVCNEQGVIQRYYGYFFVTHDQDLLGNRFTANLSSQIAGRENQLVAGLEVTDLDFSRARGFRRKIPLAAGDSVDPIVPVAGNYGDRELRGISPTDIDTRAVFLEDAFHITESITLVGALRYEELDLVRKNFNDSGVLEASGFARDFDWVSVRLGAVAKLSDDVSAYGQYSDGKDPVNNNIFLVNSGENLDLTDAEQWEVGLKGSWHGGRTQATIAYFDIQRDDVFERIGVDSAASIGGRDSNGFEISSAFSPTSQWRVGANASFIDAEFKRSTNFVTFAGNTPPNVAEVTGNLWTSYSQIAGLPLEIGGSVQYVDDRYGDNANQVSLSSYTLVDLFATWSGSNYNLTARVHNVTDEIYVPWSDVFYLQQNDPGFLYANQILLASPRMFELSMEFAF
ncbi:TonB-dependent siderophore receptor [Gammaproteobacteria bacterium]|nr:TonB-dependent siderophore receptor [Gammaproteobacteria bacterium]